MKKVIYSFLSRPVTASMFFICLIIIGVISFYNIPVELSPEVEYPKLSVSIRWQGISPETMEANVTSLVESELASVTGIKKIKSRSSEGYSRIDLEFYPTVDMDFARVEINEKLSSLRKNLPIGVSKPMLRGYIPSEFSDLNGFMSYSISADESASTIRKYVLDELVYPLSAVEGISSVDVYGGFDREISIIIDYDKVKMFGLNNYELTQSISKTEIIKSIGMIKNNQQGFFIKVNNEVTSSSMLNKVVIKKLPNGNVIKLSDIAVVIDDFKEPTNYYRINGKETVSININREPGTNTLKIAEAVKSKIKELQSILPEGYAFKLQLDRSEDAKQQLDELYSNALYSILIILIVLFLIFRNYKYAIIIISSIFFSVLLSLTMFFIFNMSLNVITIASFVLGFGIMVDNSIVVIDYLDSHYKLNDRKRFAIHLRNIFSPVFASTLTTIAIFIPLLFLSSELKLYFEQFAKGIVFTIISSLLMSFTLIPMLYSKVKKKKAKHYQESKLGYKLYSFVMTSVFRWKKVSLFFLALLIGLPVWLLPARIETTIISGVYNSIFDSDFYYEIKPYINNYFGGALNLFFNKINRGEVWNFGEKTYLYVRLELPNGNEIERMNNLTLDLEKEIIPYKDHYENVITRVTDKEHANIRIEFNAEQSNKSFPFILKNYLTSYLVRTGGLNSSVYGYGPGFSNYSGSGSSSSFGLTIKGFNYKRVKGIAIEFKDIISKSPRVDNVDIDGVRYYRDKNIYEVIAKIDRVKLKRCDIKIDEIFRIIAGNTKGNLTFNQFKIENEEIRYKVKYSNYENIQLSNLKKILIKSRNGKTYKVNDFLSFDEKKVMSTILREDQQYVRYVRFEFKGPYKYGNKFLEASLKQMAVPSGYSAGKSSFYFNWNEEAESEIWIVLVLASLLIFMITASQFESLKKPWLIFTAIPFSFIGSILLIYFTDYNLDRGGYAGMLLLVGISVNNSILLVDYISRNICTGKIEELIKLSYARVRSVVTTSITTIGALLPFILLENNNFWKNLSVTIIGGIFLSALLILIYLPLFYSKFIKGHK